MTEKGLLSRPTPKRPSQPITVSAFHDMLRNPYALIGNLHKAYLDASPRTRRLLNQALFERLVIDDTDEITGTFREPFDPLVEAAGKTATHTVSTRRPETPRGQETGPRGLSYESLVELNGARSNPRLQLELSRLAALHEKLSRKATVSPRQPRAIPPTPKPVLATVIRVLELADRPMQAREIHAAAERLAGASLSWTTVKAALAAGASSRRPRFRRTRHGVYESA